MLRHTLVKTAPADEMRMGALLLEALGRHGVTVRVDKPWRSIPSEYLVCTSPQTSTARVWVHSASCNDGMTHYDIPRAELMAVAAVVTDEESTRFVYDGFSDDNARPVAQAVACAVAVASFLGLPVTEERAAELEARQALRDMWAHGSPRCPLTRYAETAGTLADALNNHI